jgi:hypothetical protein
MYGGVQSIGREKRAIFVALCVDEYADDCDCFQVSSQHDFTLYRLIVGRLHCAPHISCFVTTIYLSRFERLTRALESANTGRHQ